MVETDRKGSFMFKKWLETHNLIDYSFDGRLISKISDRDYWESFSDERKEQIITNAEKYINYEYPMLRATD